MKDNQKLNEIVNYAMEITIRLGFLLILIAWCFRLLYPFSGIIVWSIILAIAQAPLYNSLNRKLRDNPKWTALIIILIGLIIILLPAGLFVDSLIHGLGALKGGLESGTLTIPPPTEKVASWPLIGSQVYDIWNQASQDLAGFIAKYQEQIRNVMETLFRSGLSIGVSVFQFVLATIIAGILLATRGTEKFARRIFEKIAGTEGDEFTDISIKTVRSVIRGILGVAVIQATLTGIGFMLAGVPLTGVWTLIVLVLGILQLPRSIVVYPVIFWMFSALNPLTAVLWTIYLLLAGATNNILKPILLGKGAPVPMLVIFLGVIGGFLLSGFIGLFTGAIIISLGYKLFETWIWGESKTAEKNGTVT